jgi:phasin family protein
MIIINAANGLFKAENVKRLNHSERTGRPQDSIMTPEEMQKFGKDSMATAMSSFGTLSKSAQAIAAEVADYSKKSIEGSAAAWERLMGAKSVETAMQVQGEYLKSSYEGFVAEATKLGELYADLAKEAYKPFEGALAKASVLK